MKANLEAYGKVLRDGDKISLARYEWWWQIVDDNLIARRLSGIRKRILSETTIALKDLTIEYSEGLTVTITIISPGNRRRTITLMDVPAEKAAAKEFFDELRAAIDRAKLA